MLGVEPKSTCIHCGSEYWLSQREPRLASTASAAVLAPSTDEAVAGLFSARLVVPQAAVAGLVLMLISISTTISMSATRIMGDLSINIGTGFITISPN